MHTVRFLILMMLFGALSVQASMRHMLRPFDLPTRIVSRGLTDYLRERMLSDPPLCGNTIQVECPKDEGSYVEFIGFCKPSAIKITENGRTTQRLIYKSVGANFTNADVNSVIRPTVPGLTTVETPEDIIKVATFYSQYANYMTVYFLKTREVLGWNANNLRDAFLYEPDNLLNLVRPGEPNRIIDRVAIRAEKALKNPRSSENRLIFSFSDKNPSRIGDFDPLFWGKWYPKNKDLIDVALILAKSIYKNTPHIKAYETEEEFNAALVKVDPEFASPIIEK